MKNYSIFVSIHPTFIIALESQISAMRTAASPSNSRRERQVLFSLVVLFSSPLSFIAHRRPRTHARAKRDAKRNPYTSSLSPSQAFPRHNRPVCTRWQPAARESRKGKSRCEKSASILRALRARERKQKRKEHAETIPEKVPNAALFVNCARRARREIKVGRACESLRRRRPVANASGDACNVFLATSRTHRTCIDN